MHLIGRKIASITPLSEDLDKIGIDLSTYNPKAGDRSQPLCESNPRREALTPAPVAPKRSSLLMQWQRRRVAEETKPDRVSTLMEEVQGIVAGVEQNSQEEMIKAYANAALVADTLSTRFLEMAESIAENLEEGQATDEEAEAVTGLSDLSEQYQAVAEECADSAEALQNAVEEKVFAEEVQVDQVEEHFKEILANILDGVEIFSGLTEESDEDEDEEKEAKGSSEKGSSKGGSSKGGSSSKKEEASSFPWRR